MATSFHERLSRARRAYKCSWCGERIEAGEQYRSYGWRDGSDSGHEKMHTECYGAMCRLAAEEGEFLYWTFGDFHRGCTCQAGCCQCHDSEEE